MSEKGQVTIPKKICDAVKLKTGDKVVFIKRDDEILIQKVKMKRLSEILENQKPWKLSSLEFQR